MLTAQIDSAAVFNEWAKARGWPARCDAGLVFESTTLTDLARVWCSLAGADGVVLRSQMTMRVLKPCIEDIAIVERLAEEPTRYYVRLMGTHLALQIGNLHGKIVDEAVSPDVAERWHALLDATLAENRPLRYVSSVAYEGLEHYRAEALQLPLCDTGAPPTMVLVCAVLKPNTAQDDRNTARH